MPDGIPANGDQPTVIAVGDVQLLAIAKTVDIVDGATAEPGAELAYTIPRDQHRRPAGRQCHGHGTT